MPEFAVVRRDEEHRVSVSVAGEVDIATAPELQAALTGTAGHPTVLVDLGAVTFLDASGLAALLAGHLAVSGRGGSLVLLDVPPVVRRLLRITALDTVLAGVRTADDPR